MVAKEAIQLFGVKDFENLRISQIDLMEREILKQEKQFISSANR